MSAIERRTFLRAAGLGGLVAVGGPTLLSACSSSEEATGSSTTVTNARIFDGENVIDARSVVIVGGLIHSVGGEPPSGSTVVDAAGATLLPGLIDAHVHTSVDGLRHALLFGVTTELEMQGGYAAGQRGELAGRNDLADVRSAGMGLTAPGGHPSELFGGEEPPGAPTSAEPGETAPEEHVDPPINTAADAAKIVAARVAGGSDYIKIMIEEGSVLGAPGLPMLSNEVVVAAVRATHKHDKLAIAHTLSVVATEQAIAADMDGLAHVFIDRPHTADIIAKIATAKAFVTPCLCLNASILGATGAAFAKDERVSSRLSKEWLDTLRSSVNEFPQGRFDDVLATVAALHKAGVDILVGTDASVAMPTLGGIAHGASVHHELQLLVRAGLTPVQALRAATSVPARRFGLTDRGRVVAGARADLLLVDGDPTRTISDTLSIRSVWRQGVRQPTT
jgi:imidazolonepropionase-like amidohydrolase